MFSSFQYTMPSSDMTFLSRRYEKGGADDVGDFIYSFAAYASDWCDWRRDPFSLGCHKIRLRARTVLVLPFAIRSGYPAGRFQSHVASDPDHRAAVWAGL